MGLYRRVVRHWVTSVAVSVWFVWLAWHFQSWTLGVCAGVTLSMAVTDASDAYFERWKRRYLHDRDMP